MIVRFWGVRGSIPTPGRETVRYGGNTPCVEIRPYRDHRIFILDCGTGLRELGNFLMANDQKKGPIKAEIFISHTHWDHLHGFPFFTPAYIPGNHFHIRGPVDFDENLESLFIGQMKYQYFPVKLKEMASTIEFTEMKESEFEVDGVRIDAKYLNHPIMVLGYKFQVGGKTVVYATDNEPYYNVFRGKSDFDPADPMVLEAEKVVEEENEKMRQWYTGADLLIHDAQYTDEEYQSKISWGHTSMEYLTRSANQAGVKCLAFFHHDPTRDDADLDSKVAKMKEYLKSIDPASKMVLFGAYEGLELPL